jgi:predicted acylesterase/phospholipase RssA
MRVLCLSGGGFKGGFQVPIVEYLMSKHYYDMILGVSAGSINGVCAAQYDLELMRQFWESIDDKSSLFGVKGFLRFAAYRGRGWYSLAPLQKHLKEYISLDKLKVPYGAGVVARETSEYHTLMSTEMSKDSRLHKAVRASSAIAFLMEPEIMRIGNNDKPVTLCDGGHIHVLPTPPDDAEHVDAVFCNPITHDHHKRTAIDKIFDAFFWLINMQLDTNAVNDFEALSTRCMYTNLTATVYAPEKSLGSLLDTKQSTIQERMKKGEEALKNPIHLG